MKHFLSILDTPDDVLQAIFDKAYELREKRTAGESTRDVLAGQTLAAIFEKPSLRTRVSFEQGMLELGGQCLVLQKDSIGAFLGDREPVKDVARLLSSMCHGVAARVFEHEKLIELAEYSDKPVINMLSDESHPCQALADAMTIMDEFGRGPEDLKGKRVAFIGDANNVARSLAIVCGKLGMHFVIASPGGYAFEQAEADTIMAKLPGMDFALTDQPTDAVRYADVVVTDTFVSMGQEAEKKARLEVFKDYQVNDDLLKQAPEHAIVLHCMPAYRGLEITDEVMEGAQSRIFAEAENRLHAQKGLLAVLMG